ncbi:hypothetical protein GOP47_0007835 [Adiantum capillus-veneris]|uniref:Endoplasmic reticulum transmembrane protein n=1 Tax=Adiantum capillus-veneris TaxID=13818 RepID=A0A9D4ZLX1_ADICA|nr:hypothetical protein GOP47_0007835 [Adiantum capillus-veneris]
MGFLLLYLVLVEAGVSFVLMYGRPSVLYNTVLWAIQSVNQGAPFSVVFKGFAGSLALMLAPTLFRIFKARRRIAFSGFPTASSDSLVLQTHLLEACLIGLAYYLFMIIHQLHAQVCGAAVLKKELELLKRTNAETSLKSSRAENLSEEKKETANCPKIDALESMISNLRKTIEDLQGDCKQKDEEIRAAESNMKALQKQSEGFLLEYDRLLEDNQALRGQLSLVGRKLDHSDSNKKKS